MSVPSEISARESFARIQAGDEEAFSVFFKKYYGRIYSTALQYCKIPASAEDVAQQVFLKVWEKKKTLHSIQNPEAWLFTIARNRVVDVLREQLMNDKYTRYILDMLQEEVTSPEELFIIRQKKELLEKSLLELSVRQLEVYRLSREDGLTYQEIAYKLGITSDTVKEHIAKARAKIKDFLREHQDELMDILMSVIVFNVI